MSRDDADGAVGWLTDDQQRAWLAWMRVHLRLTYEMHRQLQADSGLSLADYDVLVALSGAPDGGLQLSALAATIGWERSRLSHHLRRMGERGLVERRVSARDRRGTDLVLTDTGRDVLAAAAPGHVALVRRLFFGGLPESQVASLTSSLERIYAEVLAEGTLPPPPPAR